MSEQHSRPEDDAAEPGFLTHLFELRDRMLRMVLAVVLAFLALMPFANTIYGWFAAPILKYMPEGTGLIAVKVAAPFLIPFKLVFFLAVAITIPYLLYQMWAFVAPALYQHERRLVMPLVISSTILFYIGVAFAFFIVMPLVFGFLASFAPEGVAVTPDIGEYLSFALTMFFAFGISFEVPIATILLVMMGVTTPDSLVEKRPYIIVGAFVLGMLLTPPDVVSQLLLAIPMWFLFEAGVLASRVMIKRKKEAAEQADAMSDEPPSSENSILPKAAAPVAATAASAEAAEELSPAERMAREAFHGKPVEEIGKTGSAPDEDENYRPLSDEEMDAELDAIIASEEAEKPDDEPSGEGPEDDAKPKS